MVRAHSLVQHMNLYMNPLILDRRHNCLVIILCILAMDPLHQLSRKEKYHQLRKYVEIILSIINFLFLKNISSTNLSYVHLLFKVDVLTDLLVQGMEDNSEDSDIYGICAQCGRKVEGEGTGCSAMDKVFHIDCFCCYVCKVNLQGKPFYSLESKPYCEEDYLNTLEKCCVCTRPILDRILRATGKPYHPSCFTCVVCGQSLDGIPFTVDATNQIHCIQCFHKSVISYVTYVDWFIPKI